MHTPYQMTSEMMRFFCHNIAMQILQQQWLLPMMPPSLETQGMALLKKSMALYEESYDRLQQLLTGMQQFSLHPYQRATPSQESIWKSGSCSVRDYGSPTADAPIIFCIPSLINRSYIFDLHENCSLMQFLHKAGYHPILLEWHNPTQDEEAFGLSDYIIHRLEGAICAIAERYAKPMFMVGYCLGGIMSIAALARLLPTLKPYVKGLAVLAMPWDFTPMVTALPSHMSSNEDPLNVARALQQYFWALAPEKMLQKFTYFSHLDPTSALAEHFVATERWCNDILPLPAQVIQECTEQFVMKNALVHQTWSVGGDMLDYTPLATLKSLMIFPQKDHIVPEISAMAAIQALPFANILQVPMGHVGIMSSRRAPQQVWQPLVDWFASAL